MGNVMIGFPDYGSAVVGSDGVVAKGDLTSLASITGATAANIGTPTYGSDGMTGASGAGTSSGISVAFAAGDQITLNKQGTITFWCSTDAFDASVPPAAGQNFIYFAGGTMTFILTRQTAGYSKCVSGGTDMNGIYYPTAAGWWYGNGAGRGPMSRVDMVWDSTGMVIWVDHHVYANALWPSLAKKMAFTAFYLNSVNTSNGGTYTYKDFMVSSKKMVIPRSTKGLRRIHFYGDSYNASSGAYPDADGSGRQILGAQKGIGVNNKTPDLKSGTGYTGPSQGRNDSCIAASMRRNLARKGLFTGVVEMWAHGGSGFDVAGSDGSSKTSDRITAALRLSKPDVAVIQVGYNDAGQNSGAGPSNLTTYQATVQTSIDEIIAANPNVLIVFNTLPYYSNPTYYTPTQASVNGVNGVYAAIVAANSANCVLGDVYTRWGGIADSSYFITNDPHPSAKGTEDIGRMVADIIAVNL